MSRFISFGSIFFVAAFLSIFSCAAVCTAAESPVPGLEAWKLTGAGQRIGQDVLEVVGKGKDTSTWRSGPIAVQPGAFYRYRVSLRSTDTDRGCLPCGLGPFARDFRPNKETATWKDETFCFRMQDHVSEAAFRVGQWESTGTFQFKNIKLETVTPVMREFVFQADGKKGTLVLGAGEEIRNGRYRFVGWLGGEGSNIHRPLAFSNVTFNSNRWCLGNGSRVEYRFDLLPRVDDEPFKPIPFSDGTLKIGVCHYAGSAPGVVEISRDGETRWTELGRLDKVGTHEFVLPSIAFPMERIFLRIRGLESSNFQVDSIVLEAPLEEKYGSFELKHFNAFGETLFATCSGADPAANRKPDHLTLTTDGKIRVLESTGDASQRERLIPLEISETPEKKEQQFKVGDRTYTIVVSTHPLNRSDYGYFVSAPGGAATWWAEADWKISRNRSAPAAKSSKPIEIRAAKNDIEAFQFVVRAPDDKPIRGLTGTAGELKGPGGATIPAANVELLYAYYHFVHAKTDGTGLVDFWPDALPPLDKPIDVEENRNQPIWVNVKVPADAVAGKYEGSFRLHSADGAFDVTVPYAVRVWNFALPKVNRHETAYGFNPTLAFQYHNVKTDEDKRRVLDLYWQCFSDHRISIYNPTPFDAISVKWLPDKEDGAKSRCEIDFSRYDAEMTRVLEKFHFSNFTVPGHGLGSGTFHARHDPSLAGFNADTPQYKAMMTDYYTKLVAHLKEKGRLEKSYVYWFDEPGRHDYEFVAAGTGRLQHYAPELARMMTLMMRDRGFLDEMEKIGTSINIWCPVSSSFDEVLARERMEKGERFWWYVCTGPKAPYCTLFIDHPATELRVWHWQAWQRGIVGSLIWQTNYWHSGAAFPNGFQNPYEDPMGYVSGYSTSAGTKRHWGNGDGRFIYPPLAAAVPGGNDGKPIFDKPVSSIRWAMIREGVEDYEMFYVLRELLETKGAALSETERQAAETLLAVPESVTKSMTEFTIDPRPLLQRRTEIGAMIEKLAGR